ncbi:tetratricopeptide repeat protein, partial [Anabaena sp. CA = ATCC 33047]|uniref:tetratricopeptide repeat protein n=1 Tax=Anabaena sp. (strain CA / ATCC 33047) TaxID=52271 RepID=UPI000A6B01A0
ATNINNKRLISYSHGILGKLQPEQAQTYFIKALSLAQSIQAWDLAYQWSQQLATLYQQQGKYQKAIKSYETALAHLTKVRDNLSSTNIDLQFSFYENVEPLYRNYMRLLLNTSHPQLD